MRNKRHFWRHRILGKLMLPIMAVMLVQTALYFFFFWQGNIIAHIENNAYDILSERVLNRQQYLENEMIHKWSNIQESEERILNAVSSALAENGAVTADIYGDPELNERIVMDAASELIYLLRRNSVTGAFLVLDGPANVNGAAGRAGLYLRDLDPGANTSDNSDLLLERGMPRVSKSLNIALDSYWSAGFEFSEAGDQDNELFFFKPLLAARASGNKESENFGYWSPSFSLSGLDGNVITYSLPLIDGDGEVFGVLGVDIAERYLLSQLKYNEIAAERGGAYLLAVTRDGGETYRRVIGNGPVLRYRLGESGPVSVKERVYDNIYSLDTANNGEPLYASIIDFKLYNANTPFAGERWALIGMIEKENLLSFADQIRGVAVMSTAVSLLLGLCCVYLASRRVTSPITALVKSLRESDPNGPVTLKKLNIEEIDELTVSIENMSRSVADAASRISKIISMTRISLGVFEISPNKDYVFCSASLFSVLGWREVSSQDNQYVPKEEFVRNLARLRDFLIEPEEELIFRLIHNDRPRWVQLTLQTEEDGRVLGTVSDITKDMLVKQKIEYERDYDLLTNLYNHRAFHEKMTKLFERGDLGVAAMIMWDLDNLKYINDTYGHDCGDWYIRALSECLEHFRNYRSIVARRSGDEFYTLLYGYSSKEEIRAIIGEVWQVIQQSSLTLPDGTKCRVRTSGGVAWYPDDALDGEELIRYADFAMYQSKRTMKGNLQEFDQKVYLEDAFILNGPELLNRLIEDQLVDFALQPVYDVAAGSVYGYEMLMRPQTEEVRSPFDVLRMAQVHSKLYHIERLSWFKGMGTFAKLAEQGRITGGQRVFLNSIGSQILSEADFQQFARQYEPYLKRLVLEITESEPGNKEYLKQKIKVTRQWGGLLAIDDYGTGYNSEASLIFLSPDLVKVDMSIVRDIDKDENRQNILESLLNYAGHRTIKVLAEGVETEEEMRFLVRAGVDYLQGYYVARPDLEVREIDPAVVLAVADAYAGKKRSAAPGSGC